MCFILSFSIQLIFLNFLFAPTQIRGCSLSLGNILPDERNYYLNKIAWMGQRRRNNKPIREMNSCNKRSDVLFQSSTNMVRFSKFCKYFSQSSIASSTNWCDNRINAEKSSPVLSRNIKSPNLSGTGGSGYGSSSQSLQKGNIIFSRCAKSCLCPVNDRQMVVEPGTNCNRVFCGQSFFDWYQIAHQKFKKT